MSVVTAEGTVFELIVDERYERGDLPLEHHAFRRWHLAQRQTPWGRKHIRPVAVMKNGTVVASATRFALAGILDQRPVSVYGIGSVLSHSRDGNAAPARALVEHLLDDAVASGAEVALLFSPMDDEWRRREGFHAITQRLVELTLTPTPRPGAPMVLVRGGEDRDLAAIAAMGQIRSAPFRFHLDRDLDFVQHAIAAKRLLAGFGASGVQELQFFIAEEGITAAAYVVISVVGRTWTLEECGDRDPTGARIGALLQALVAREPASHPPIIRGWLPPAFVPPQATVAPSEASDGQVFARLLGDEHDARPLTADDTLYWHNDLF